MAVITFLLAALAGGTIGLSIGRLLTGEWLWQTLGKSSANTGLSRSQLRQSSPPLKPRRKTQTESLSPRGAKCTGSSKVDFNCGDKNCELCHTKTGDDALLIEFDRIRRIAEESRQRKLREYEEYVNGLEELQGAIRLFRTWRLFPDGTLKAMTQNHTWKRGENVTLASGGDAAADSGFYGFNSLAELREQEEEWWEASQSGEPKYAPEYDRYGRRVWRKTGRPLYWYVSGTILAYGHVKLSARGGRCQKAVPEYIIEPNGSDPDFGMLVVNAAEKYDMKIITVEDADTLRAGQVPWDGRTPE